MFFDIILCVGYNLLCKFYILYLIMFSEYLEDIKPSDDILEKWQEEWQKDKENSKSNVDNFDKNGKDDSTELKEKKEQERQAEEAKAKINEWYSVLSNWYPQWFQKTLSNVEKDGKEISNILNINFREKNWERQLSLSISEREKEKWKESNTTRNIITWDFSNFQENLLNNNKDNSQDFRQNIFPSIAITKTDNFEDIWRVLSQIFWWNENQGEYLSILTQVSEQQNISKIVWLIDKNIMRSPINWVYWYVQRDQIKQREDQSNKIDNFRTFLCELQFTPQKNNDEMLKYIQNPENFNNNENIQEYCEIVAALCALCRYYTIWEIIELLGIPEEEQKERLKEPSLITWEFVVEYLSSLSDSEVSLFIQNKDRLINLSKLQNN